MAVIALGSRLTGYRPARPTTALMLATAVFLWSEPVFTTFRYGQINLAVLALVLWDFTRPPTSAVRGFGIGLAAAIKVTPAIFIVHLLITRRLRAAAVAAVTFAATLVVSGTVLPKVTAMFWTHDVFDTDRVGRLENAANQSIRALLVRLDHTRDIAPGELLLVLLVAVAGLGCASLAHRRLGDAWGLACCAVTGLLISPISWTHHWVWCVPISILLWHQTRTWAITTLIFWTFAVWAVPHQGGVELHFNPLQIAVSNWYIAFGVTFVALTAHGAHTSRHGAIRQPKTSVAAPAAATAGREPHTASR